MNVFRRIATVLFTESGDKKIKTVLHIVPDEGFADFRHVYNHKNAINIRAI